VAIRSNFYKGNEVYISTYESLANSTSVALAASASFTGNYENALGFTSIVVSCISNVEGILYVDFSPDGTNTDSTLAYDVSASLNEVHRLIISKKFFRIRYTNGDSPQTTFRLQTILGNHSPVSSPLNTVIQQDADALVTRTITEEVSIVEGKHSGYSIVNKFGLNSDIDTATVPEDVWEGGGVYTGWATAAQTVEVFSSSAADTAAGTGARTVHLIGLDANYNVISETITLNGVTGVNTTGTFIRVHTALVQSAGSGGVNAGEITFRQTTTTANKFLTMLEGRNQTNCSAYTIPAGYTGYMRTLHAAAAPSNSAAVQGNIWTRTFGQVFRSRRPFFCSDSYRLSDTIYGGLVFSEKSDIIIRIISCTANNVAVNAGYDLIWVKN
jgi:hypothetical protein